MNDTVGTLVAYAYSDPKTFMGVILGTGTNAAYVEDIKQIIKWRGGDVPSGAMIVNMEWGGFDNERLILPLTKYDRQLDKESLFPGTQTFEKLVSGMYLGELVRLVLLDLIEQGALFGGKPCDSLEKRDSFQTAFMSRVERYE